MFLVLYSLQTTALLLYLEAGMLELSFGLGKMQACFSRLGSRMLQCQFTIWVARFPCLLQLIKIDSSMSGISTKLSSKTISIRVRWLSRHWNMLRLQFRVLEMAKDMPSVRLRVGVESATTIYRNKTRVRMTTLHSNATATSSQTTKLQTSTVLIRLLSTSNSIHLLQSVVMVTTSLGTKTLKVSTNHRKNFLDLFAPQISVTTEGC